MYKENNQYAWLWYWQSIDVSLIIPSTVATLLSNHRQLTGQNEKGGQLFIQSSSEGLILVDATPPHIKDKSGHNWLCLDPRRCRSEIIEANKKGYQLIGYWHTHAEAIPNLSKEDNKSFKIFSRDNNKVLPKPLAVIVGQSNEPEGIRAWSLQDQKFILAERYEKLMFTN